ncbi:MAG: hypothetical protein ACRDKG_12935, partial [Actinomycetota bacterium]
MDQEIVVDSRDRSRGAVSPTLVACAAGLVAAGAHAAVVREHFGHWWGYGAFFAVVAVVQAIAAVSLYRRPSRRLMLAVAIGNFGLILLYASSRALGSSFVGPHAGHAEPIGLLDLVANSAEGIQLAVVFWVLRRSEQVVPRPERSPRLAFVALLAVAAIAVGVPGAPAHVESPANTINILAAAAPTPELPQPHDIHTEDPQLAPIVEEPSTPETPPPCTPHPAPGDTARFGSGAVVYSHDGDLWIAAQP